MIPPTTLYFPVRCNASLANSERKRLVSLSTSNVLVKDLGDHVQGPQHSTREMNKNIERIVSTSVVHLQLQGKQQ